MDDRTTGESPHELLLALAGRIDDDLLAWCRELVAVGEDARALELITATLIADRTPLPPSVRTALVGATRTARTDLDADSALAPATTDDGTAHRFDTELPGAHNLAAAVGALPTRQIAGCRSWVTMRTTPAGSAPGPLPQPVVLVEVGADDTRPVDIMAYQLAIACARTGVPAAVEVVVAGTDRPAYHETALASAIAVHGADEPVVDGSVPAPPVEPAPELLSPGSPDTLFAETMHAETTLADTGPVPVGPEAPRPFPRRAAREDDDAGAAFRAASATSGVRSAPEPFESSLFASAPPAEPLDARPLDEGLFDPGPADQPPAAASVAGPPGAESPVTDASTVGRAASGPSDSEAADPGTTDPGPTDPQATDPQATDPRASDPRATDPGASGPGTSELPRRPRPVTALRGLSQATPRPTPVRPSAVTPMPRPQPGRRGNLSPVAEPAAVRDQPEVPSAHTPAFAFLGDPLDGPVEDRPTDGRGEPMIDANDPLGLGLLPVPAPEVPGPPAEPVSDSWLADWITGDWAMSPSALDGPPAGDRPAEPFPGPEAGSAVPEVRTAGPRPSPRPEPAAGPDPTRTGRRRAADAVREPSPEATGARTGRPRPSPVAPPAAPRPASAHPPAAAAHPVAQRPAAPRPSVAEPPAVEPPTVRPSAVQPPAVEPSAVEPSAVEPSAVEPPESSLEQTGFVLRPESVARLSEADRELLARLQAELAGNPRPRLTRRAGIGGTNGSAAPPDMAG